MTEIWKRIPGFESYEICNSDKDQVRSIKTGKVLLIQINKAGYNQISLFHNKTKTTIQVHRLKALTFIPNIDNKPFINHIDFNKLNNSLTNLEWVTPKENIIHSRDNDPVYQASILKGEKCGNSILKEEDVILIRELFKKNRNAKLLATRFKVDITSIYNILKRKTWKHI